VIRWCCYCQDFIGECAPYDDVSVTHGICEPCRERLVRGDPLKEQTASVRALSNKLFESARQGDHAACAATLAEAKTVGMDGVSILVGLVQPALYRAGLQWQGGQMSVAEEHRVTSWCERMFALLAPAPMRPPPVDLLILQAPGNAHTLGPRFAREVLSAWGLSVEVVVPELPLDEAVALVRQWRPRVVGLSCALASQVPVATAYITQLRARLWPAIGMRYLLSGFAFRLGGGAEVPRMEAGIDAAVELSSARQIIAESEHRD
jgi:methanogenic corrinoid protein MtbC1